MYSRSVLIILATLLFAPVTAKAGSAEDAVKAAYAAWDAAFNKGDAKAVADFYTDDAIFLPPTHDVTNGPSGVEKFFAGLFSAGVTGHKLELLRAEEQGSIIVAASKWSAKAKDATVGGIATHVFEKQPDGSLKLKLHTFN